MKLRLWTPDGPEVEGVDYNHWSEPIWTFSEPERLFGTHLLDRYFHVRYEEGDDWGVIIPMETDERDEVPKAVPGGLRP